MKVLRIADADPQSLAQKLTTTLMVIHTYRVLPIMNTLTFTR